MKEKKKLLDKVVYIEIKCISLCMTLRNNHLMSDLTFFGLFSIPTFKYVQEIVAKELNKNKEIVHNCSALPVMHKFLTTDNPFLHFQCTTYTVHD